MTKTQRIKQLEKLVEEQRQEIDELLKELEGKAELEDETDAEFSAIDDHSGYGLPGVRQAN